MISYKKKVSGWGFEKAMYTADLGNSYDEAVNDAAGNREASNASYTVLRQITVR